MIILVSEDKEKTMNDNWNDDWREELKQDDYEAWTRLADCDNRRSDILCFMQS